MRWEDRENERRYLRQKLGSRPLGNPQPRQALEVARLQRDVRAGGVNLAEDVVYAVH